MTSQLFFKISIRGRLFSQIEPAASRLGARLQSGRRRRHEHFSGIGFCGLPSKLRPGCRLEGSDRQFEMAAANGMKTIIAEMITAAPEWAYRKFAHARLETVRRQIDQPYGRQASRAGSPACVSTMTILKPPPETFLRALATRCGPCRPGPVLIFGTVQYWPRRVLLPGHHGKVPCLAKRPNMATCAPGQGLAAPQLCRWEDVEAPRQPGPYPDMLDWLSSASTTPTA